MKTVRLLNLLLILGLLTACAGGFTKTPAQLPTVPVNITPAPSADTALRGFLDAMLVEDYPMMYSFITQAVRNTISETDFAKRYTDDLNAMSAKTVEYNI